MGVSDGISVTQDVYSFYLVLSGIVFHQQQIVTKTTDPLSTFKLCILCNLFSNVEDTFSFFSHYHPQLDLTI